MIEWHLLNVLIDLQTHPKHLEKEALAPENSISHSTHSITFESNMVPTWYHMVSVQMNAQERVTTTLSIIKLQAHSLIQSTTLSYSSAPDLQIHVLLLKPRSCSTEDRFFTTQQTWDI